VPDTRSMALLLSQVSLRVNHCPKGPRPSPASCPQRLVDKVWIQSGSRPIAILVGGGVSASPVTKPRLPNRQSGTRRDQILTIEVGDGRPIPDVGIVAVLLSVNTGSWSTIALHRISAPRLTSMPSPINACRTRVIHCTGPSTSVQQLGELIVVALATRSASVFRKSHMESIAGLGALDNTARQRGSQGCGS